MIVYVTSNCCSPARVNGKKVPSAINNINGILDSLKSDVKKQDAFVFVTSSYSSEVTQKRFESVCASLSLSGFNFKNCICIGDNNKKQAKNYIKNADLIFLSGGLVPEQNDFFNEIKLQQLLKDYNGVIIGQSAGAMNLAKDVYNYPEEPEELGDRMFVTGLGLTNISVIPHFNKDTGNDQVDPSIDLWNILNGYSKKTTLLCLPNNSHIVVKDGTSTVYGLAYTLTNCKLTQICENGKSTIYTGGRENGNK